MTEPFLGEIRNFGFNFAPRGWATCQGQLLAISTNTALFSLLGTTYGGNGQTTFSLPDLRGRAPIGVGQGPGLTDRVQGEMGGVENVTLTAPQVAPHSHGVAASSAAASKSPANAYPAFTAAGSSYGTTADMAMNPGMVTPNSGGQPHENMQPDLGSNWCIALEGIFPSRN
jgi:microcystin-dependent protein